MSSDWSRDELQASVRAYLDMQGRQRRGEPYVKKRYYEDLAQQYGRSAKSFEYRMQNISYVLALMGKPWLQGLRPARNVGAKVAVVLESIIMEATGLRRAPVAGFEIATREHLQEAEAHAPLGNEVPQLVGHTATRHERDPRVKAWVLRNAAGRCECCGCTAPFRTADGLPYLEIHHVRQLAEGGSDTVSNTVALCPNCHRELHYGQQAQELISQLYERIERLASE